MVGLAPTPLSGRASKTRMASITSHAQFGGDDRIRTCTTGVLNPVTPSSWSTSPLIIICVTRAQPAWRL